MYSLVYLLLLLPCILTCHHDELDFIVERISLEELSSSLPFGRSLAVADREYIRVAAYYYLDEPSSFIAKKIKEQLIPAAISYFENTLKVDRLSSNLKITQGNARMCGVSNPPDVLTGDGIPVDLVLFVTGKKDADSSATASARPCVLLDPTNRPILGVINYNYGSSWSGTSEASYEGDVMTTIHELTHVLGFTPSLYDDYVNAETGARISYPAKTKVVNGVNTSVLMLPPLTARLQNYFNCPTLDGAYMENQGGSGSKNSHFERRIFYNELMTASEGQDRVSEFTLAALEGTGWYTPNYAMADPVFWGKGKGCGFLDQTCYDSGNSKARFDEFCSARKAAGCNYGATSKAVCGTQRTVTSDNLDPAFNYFGDNSVMLDNFADNCPYNYGISNLGCTNPKNSIKEIKGEVYGEGSMCFMGNLGKSSALSYNLAYCFQQTCLQILPGVYSIKLDIGNETVICNSNAEVTLPGYKGTIKCPDTKDFCTTKALKFCKRGCMGRGTCVDGTCVCRDGYYGASCGMSTFVETNDYDNTFLHPLAVFIGLGIVAVVVIIGLIVKKVQKMREQAEDRAGYISVHGVSGKPMNLGKSYQSKGPTNTETLRQQALTYNAPSNIRGGTALSVIRGVRGQV